MGNGLQGIIYFIIAICVILAIALAIVLAYIWYKDNRKKQELNDTQKSDKNKSNSPTKLQGIESMSKFLAFDDIVDSMIVRKNRTQYVMVIQCKGVNFDLLGEEEKMAVESGFTQFLNTLRFPVQLYVQSRSLNLKDSIDKYQARVNEVKDEIVKLDNQIKREQANGRLDLVRRLQFDRRRKMNILEYGADITNYVARLSQNRNVLQQNTYVAVAYYTNEFGGQIANYSKEEIDNIAFSELYTRAQTLIRALSASGVTGKVMNSEELAELLYVAYNRDDSELISVKKAIESQYDSLYHTAKDVLEKQKEMIEEKVDKEAIDLTSQSIAKADRILKLRQENKEEIRRRAMAYVERYKGEMTSDLYEETKRQVEKAKIGEEPRKETKITKPTKEVERKTVAKKRPTAVQAESEIRTEQPRVRRRRPTVTE
ncbi:MAG: hypothetical protein IKN65_02100 [Clostridia bacterium]|nr:hypothetical protein [Clostridia bacterium]